MSNKKFQHRPQKEWLSVQVEIASDLADIGAAFLGTITEGGIRYHTEYKPETSNRGTDTITISGSMPFGSKTQAKLNKLNDFLQQLSNQHLELSQPKVTTETILEQDWGQSWKIQFKPIHVTSRLVIKPSWEHYVPRKGELILELDPGMAFGTGMHASTQLSLELIDNLYTGTRDFPLSLLDVGTGTGILGMSAALFGCPKVVGIDNDLDARTIATENIIKNQLTNYMRIIDQDLSSITDTFDLVVANIIHNTIIELSYSLADRVAPKKHLILAGILAGPQTENIIHTFTALNFTRVNTIQREEWSALLMQRQ